MQDFYNWQNEDTIEALASKHFDTFMPSMEVLEVSLKTKSYSSSDFTKHLVRDVKIDEPEEIKVKPHTLKKGIVASLKRTIDNLFPKRYILTDERIFLQADTFGRYYFKIDNVRYYIDENMEVAIDLEGYLWEIVYTNSTYQVVGGINKYEGDFPFKFASEKLRDKYYDGIAETELDPVFENPFTKEQLTSDSKVIDFIAYKEKQMKR